MESFSDQLKRHDKYFSQMAHFAKQYVDQNMKVQSIIQKFAQSVYTFAQGELQHNRTHLQSFGELLQKQSDSIAIQLRNMQEFFECFNVKQEIQQMKVIAQAQAKAVPPFNKEMNLQFIQNAAVYQQNRQRQLKIAMVNLSNAFMGQAAALFEAATNLRQSAAAVDDLTPRVDMARRFVHLELEGDICDILGLSKQDYDGYDIRGYQPAPIETVRRGIPRPEDYLQQPQYQVQQQEPFPFNQASSVGPTNQQNVQLQKGLGVQSQLGASEYNPGIQQQNSIINQSLPPQQTIQAQSPPAQPIKNMYAQPQPIPEYKEEKPQNTRNLDPAVSLARRYPNVKAYEFGDSLFDEESDDPGLQNQQNLGKGIIPGNDMMNAPNNQHQRNNPGIHNDIQFDDQFQQEQSKYLLEQLSTMQAMIQQLTNPNTDQVSGPDSQSAQLDAAKRQMTDAVAKGGIEDPDAYAE